MQITAWIDLEIINFVSLIPLYHSGKRLKKIHNVLSRFSIAVQLFIKIGFLCHHGFELAENIRFLISCDHIKSIIDQFCPFSLVSQCDAMLFEKESFLLQPAAIGHYKTTVF